MKTNNEKAVGFAVNPLHFGPALLSAFRLAKMAARRDFDIFIASDQPLEIPPELEALGIKNVALGLNEDIRALGLKVGFLPPETYYRLWFPKLLGHRYRRILYLDSDVYPLGGDISRALDIDLGTHPLAAVLDKEQWRAPTHPVLDFEWNSVASTRYINSGVLLLDVVQFEAQDVLGRVIERHRQGVKSPLHDQALLNLTLKGDLATLSPLWNWQWKDRYPMLGTVQRPFLVHLTGPEKPWAAHKVTSRLPWRLIKEYRDFLQRHDAALAFDARRTELVREPLRGRLNNLREHIGAWSRFRRQASAYPDPYLAKHRVD